MSTTASSARIAFLDRRSMASDPLHACRTKAAASARRVRQRIDLLEMNGRDAGHDQLRDAIAARDAERLGTVIDQDHLHLAAIVGVDCAGRVQYGDTVLEREARARADLAFVALGDRERD